MFFPKNVRIYSFDPLVELAAELYNIDWDIIYSMKPEVHEAVAFRMREHTFLHTSEIATQAAGMAILLHRQHIYRVGQVRSPNEKFIFLDLCYKYCCIRFTLFYLPHTGYSMEDLRILYNIPNIVLNEIKYLYYKIIVGGDFNTELHVGYCGNFLDEFACIWRLQVANYENHDNCWIFCSSLGVRRTIDLILHDMNDNVLKCNISGTFDLDSDHRTVFAQFTIPNQISARRKNACKKQTNWKKIDAQTFHSNIGSTLSTTMPTTLHDLEAMLLCCRNAAEKSGNSVPTLKPSQNPIIQILIQERHGCRDKTQRAMLSKQIRQHLRANEILTEFSDLGNIAMINNDPARHQTKLNSAEPFKEDFTTTLSAIFSSDADRVLVVGANPGPSPFLDIKLFSLAKV